MNDIDRITYREEIRNQLPARYDTWLHFYDSLSDELKQESVVQIRIDFDEWNYRQHFNQPLEPRYRRAEITYKIDRDFMLARVAELLLPARYSKQVLDSFSRSVLSGVSYSQQVSEFVEPLWAVAKCE